MIVSPFIVKAMMSINNMWTNGKFLTINFLY